VFRELDLPLDAHDLTRLVLFPEMDEATDAPEITEGCWSILQKSPASVMCATSHMVVKRRGPSGQRSSRAPSFPYDQALEMGATLNEAAQAVKLNHRHCARVCVLGGASCSPHATA
jgi:hypothetical protein